jgi:tetratricopeptide (TPR) repeat protein
VGLEIGTSKEMVSRWETGERMPSPYYQDKLCVLFGVSAADLSFIEPLSQEQTLSIPSTPSQEVLSLLVAAVSQGIIMAVRELERTGMDTSKRNLLKLLGTSIVLAGVGGEAASFVHSMLNGDQMDLYASEIAKRWAVYHSGNTLQALDGLGMWLTEVENFAKEATGEQRGQAFMLTSISYQLQGSLYRDRMEYTLAHNSYKKAYLAADENDNLELKSSALARRGVTFIQQQKPIDAIQYLESALTTLDDQEFPGLRGYIYQALSEAHAMAQHRDESWMSIDLAEQVLAQKNDVVESSNCRLNTTSVMAQKGVNTVLLKNYDQAIALLNTGIAQYNPKLMRGRARLIAQKAEAYYGLGYVDQSTEAAEMAYSIARNIGSEKTISRVKNLYAALQQSPYRKAKSVINLGMMLGTMNA